MRVIELADDRRLIERLVKHRERQERRPSGLHVSQVIDSLVATMGPKYLTIRDPEDDPDSEHRPMFFALGVTWEETIKQALAAEGIHGRKPAPLWRGGMWHSPDFQDRRGVPHEFKWTMKSSVEGAQSPKIVRYIWQLADYMYWLEQEKGVLHVGHATGDWRPPLPVYRPYRIRMTEVELGTRWRAIKQHAREKGWL